MSNIEAILAREPPRSLTDEALKDWLNNWPVRDQYHPSPSDWRDEVFYFLLPDRFSNGQERPERLLDCDLSTPAGIKRIRLLRGPDWRWDRIPRK